MRFQPPDLPTPPKLSERTLETPFKKKGCAIKQLVCKEVVVQTAVAKLRSSQFRKTRQQMAQHVLGSLGVLAISTHGPPHATCLLRKRDDNEAWRDDRNLFRIVVQAPTRLHRG